MKKIGIDGRLLRQTGVGTYLQNLLYHLDRDDLTGITIFVYLMAKDFNKVEFRNKNIVKKKAEFHWHSFGEQLGFLKTLNKDNLDLMHFTYFSYPVLYWRKFLATVHDTTPLLFKTGKASTRNQFIYQIKHFIFKIALYFQVKRAVRIITPTLTVKRELTKIYGGMVAAKTKYIYEGVNSNLSRIKENRVLAPKFKDFFIYVGNFYPHKNVERLIAAFSKLKIKSTLILIGPDDYFTERLRPLISRKTNITIVKNPPTKDLIFFYKHAKALIHPSLSEGFGLPLVEAAHFGCPIIASNIPVFKELLGDNYVSFNPYNTEDIVRAIKKFITIKSKPDYSKILKKFSFEKMAKETLKIYYEI